MEARATARFVRVAPRKVRLVVDLIRGRSVDESLSTLRFLRKAAKAPVERTLRSAVANVFNTKDGANLEPSDLFVKAAYVDEGPTLKRFRAGPMGRGMMVRKRMCHVTVVVSDKQKSAKKAEKAEATAKKADRATKRAAKKKA